MVKLELEKEFCLCSYHREHTTIQDTTKCKDCKWVESDEWEVEKMRRANIVNI